MSRSKKAKLFRSQEIKDVPKHGKRNKIKKTARVVAEMNKEYTSGEHR